MTFLSTVHEIVHLFMAYATSNAQVHNMKEKKGILNNDKLLVEKHNKLNK